MTIVGRVVYVELSGGFWSIESSDGKKWLPVNLPNILKKKGLRVCLEAQVIPNYNSIYMWGTAINIHQYQLI